MVIDGFELTRLIRAQEAEAGHEHIPIIAITANAMKGEAERCLAAGMDAYLAKPIELGRLNEMLARHLQSFRTEGVGALPAPTQLAASGVAEPALLDLTLLRETFPDDESKIDHLLKRFIEIGRETLVEIARDIDRQDGAALGDSSHKLKSSALTAGALALAESCRKLEEAARQTNWSAIESLKSALIPEFDRVASAVARKMSAGQAA